MKNEKLLNHQLIPVKYMLGICRNQHGLIVNHKLGSGKTLIALTFLRNFPTSYKKVIICPKALETQWNNGIEKYNLKNTKVISFDYITLYKESNDAKIPTSKRTKTDYRTEIKNMLNDAICIIDEAHNLYRILNDFGAYYLFSQEQAKKGENNGYDVISFINTLYSTKKILLLTGTIIKKDIADIRWLINIAAGKEIVPYNPELFLAKYEYHNPADVLYIKLINPFIKKNPFRLIPKETAKKLDVKGKNTVEFLTKAGVNHLIGKLIEKNLGTILFSKLNVFFLKTSLAGILSIPGVSLLPGLFISLILGGISSIFGTHLNKYYQIKYGFPRFSSKKLDTTVGRYISYFNEPNLIDYPVVKEYIKRENYTTEQLRLLIKMLGIPENITDEEYVLLGLFDTTQAASFGKDYKRVIHYFDYNGRAIGNLYKNPNKFKRIAEMYKSNKVSTVVYSNFNQNGIQLLSKYLNECNIKHNIIDIKKNSSQINNILDNFNKSKKELLLISPEFAEGISILGCRVLHILEPIAETTKKNQVIGRVVRYKSHSHLKPEERNIKVYNWGCSLFRDINKVLHTKTYIKEFIKTELPIRPYLDILSAFSVFVAPDDKILETQISTNNFYDNIDKVMKQISIEQRFKEIEVDCCISGEIKCSKKLIKCSKLL